MPNNPQTNDVPPAAEPASSTGASSARPVGAGRRFTIALAGMLLVVLALVWQHRRSGALSPLAQARKLAAAGQFKPAIERFGQHLANAPNDDAVRIEMIAALAGVSPADALVECQQIPADSAEFAVANQQIARLALALAKQRDGEASLLHLESGDPQNPNVHLALAQFYFHSDRLQQALLHAQQAADRNPQRAQTFVLLAELYDNMGRPVDMVAPLEKALALEPDDYETHLNLSYACLAAGRLHDARRHATWCLARQPGDLTARLHLAKSLRDEGRCEQAMAEVRTVLQHDPDHLQSRLLEAELLLFDRKAAAAFDRLTPLYAAHRDDRRLVGLLARSANAAGKRSEANLYDARLVELKLQQTRPAR